MEKMNSISHHFSDEKKDELEGLNYEGKKVEQFQRGEIQLRGDLELPVDLCNQLYQLQLNQSKIAARLDLLFGILRRMGLDKGNGKVEKKLEEDLSRIKWGKSEEEQKLTLFQIFKEVEDQGRALRTTEFKELGGKYSTAVSYSYKIFGGWKMALKNYRDYRHMVEVRKDLAEKKE